MFLPDDNQIVAQSGLVKLSYDREDTSLTKQALRTHVLPRQQRILFQLFYTRRIF